MTEIFRTVLNMSITTAYICFAVMLLRLLMKKLPKKYSYALWIIPFFRMVCPFSIQSAISLFNFIKPKNAAGTIEYIPSNTVALSKPVIDTGISLPSAAGGTEPVEIPLPPPQVAESANPMQIIMFAASILWLTGLGFLLIYSIFCFVKMRATVKDSEHFSDNVYVCKNIDSPFVFGVIKPKIYIPDGISQEHLTYILAHEKVHIRRCDYLIKPLGFIACAVHWFNPLVWVGFKLMERDMEQSCDEIAINGFEADVRKQYAETLLDISMRQNKLKGGQLVSFGENSVKSRIKGVISMKKPTIIITIIAVVVVAIAAVCLLTNGKEEKKIPFPENEKQAMELIGVLRSDIVRDWGKPDGTLSGMWGDMWENDDKHITLYFEGTDLNDAVICGVHYEDKKTGDIFIIPNQSEYDDLSTTTPELTSSADVINNPYDISDTEIQQSASPAETSPTQAPVSETELIETKANEAESENPGRIPEDRLAEWDFGKLIAETASPEFDTNAEQKNRLFDELGDDELKEAYQKAYALFMISYRSCDDLINHTLLTEYYGEDFYSDAPEVKMPDGRIMNPSGYLYEGFENAFYDTFTGDRVNEFLVRFYTIAARDGKELVYEVASNTRHCSPEYEILSRTEDEIVIRETCYEVDSEDNRLDTILYVNDNRFVKEDGTWKCAAFETKNTE